MGSSSKAESASDKGPGRQPQPPGQAAEVGRHWTLLSNHGHVLLCLARDPEARLRDVALSVGITERAVQKTVSDLEAASVVERVRDNIADHKGRRAKLTVPFLSPADVSDQTPRASPVLQTEDRSGREE